EWVGQQQTCTLRLTQLSTEQTLQIAEERLRAARHGPAVAHLVAEKAEGNPLFAEEIASFLIEQNEVYKSTCSEVSDALVAEVPSGLRSLLAARIDRLDVADRALLQAAAVMGRTFDPDLLSTVTNAKEG